MADDLEKLVFTIMLSKAEVVAIPEAMERPIVRHDLSLIIEEGRVFTIVEDFDDESPGKCVLMYDCIAYERDAGYPERWAGLPASVVITGTRGDGSVIEIKGDAYIGDDDKRSLSITFDEAPSMQVVKEGDENSSATH